MAFDQANAANLAALKSEVNTDPVAVGYNATSGNTQALLKLLNDASNNPGGETTNQTLTVGVLLDVMMVSDFDAQQVSDGERRYLEAFMNRDFDVVIEPYRAKIRDAFKSGSTTVNAIDALIRPLSRAEVLFGEGTVISRADWLAARDS
jgi:hypothetical protein